MPCARISIAEAILAFSGDECLPTLGPEYEPFGVPDTGLPTHGRYRVVESIQDPAPPSDEDLLWSGGSWRLARDGKERLVIQVRDTPSDHWRSTARVDAHFANGDLVCAMRNKDGLSPLATKYPTDRVLIVNRLAYLGALVLHASGILVEGRAILFCGPAEIGKSTMADLWCRHGQASLLNDDRMILRSSERGPLACAAPWHGKNPFVDPRIVTPAAIFHLSQANTHSIETMGPSVAAAALLASSVTPFYNPGALEKAVEAAALVAAQVPSGRLSFAPRADVVDTCLSWLRTSAL